MDNSIHQARWLFAPIIAICSVVMIAGFIAG